MDALKTIDLLLPVDGFAAPIAVCAAYTHSTFGGVRHYQVGVGTAGKLLAVYWGVEHRGVSGLRESTHGDSDVPVEVYHAVCEALRAHFRAEWES